MRGRYVTRTWQPDAALYVPAGFREPCEYQAFVPDVVARWDQPIASSTAGVVSDAEDAVRKLNRRYRPALAPLARLLMRTESIASSKVEGMQVDAHELARGEARLENGREPEAPVAEVLATIDAMEFAVMRAATSSLVTVSDISKIHAELMAAAPNSQVAGRIRTVQSWIGGNDYNPCARSGAPSFVPPPPAEVRRLLVDLCVAMDEHHLPPLVQAAIVHAQFELVHPFVDGNGRTGRALIHVVLRRRGLAPDYVPPVSVVLAADKDAYIRGLEAFRADDIGEWLTMFAVAMTRAAALGGEYLDDVEALQERWRERLRAHTNPRADAAAWRILDVLPGHPVISAPVAVAATARTKAAVNGGLARLEEAGVLIRLPDGERTRMWEAEGLLDLLAGLEAGVRHRSEGHRS